MAGIYLHIPFCKSRCQYCDFFSTTLLPLREEYVNALQKELVDRKYYLPDPQIDTIYFGGGTPSLLSSEQIAALLLTIRRNYQVSPQAEITIEANPGDLTTDYLHALRAAGINRLSIGIQSFNTRQLQLLGRRHTAAQAIESVKTAQQCGFQNLSIDLIYGLPNQTLSDCEEELNQALMLGVQHISTYCLTYEEGTPLTAMRDKGTITPADDDLLNSMYAQLQLTLTQHGFEHYEVSNFALPGYRSRHNSSYWTDSPYLGVGAAAHSYDGQTRQWNIADLDSYISSATKGDTITEKETLSETDKYNERIMLSLRTNEGIDLGRLSPHDRDFCLKQAKPYLESRQLRHSHDRIIATMAGINILNLITEHLMQ